ncbi:MAG: Coenzyme F420 hydrogenase/dehydrogenase, beta subunit C-terminal domain [Coriobacteriia bacterium]|nr:Coenzyme F420 hydrogenase/dehydrogenase, beta subunit C-terminal domain [Coriobacteriia bacterium]
MRPSCFACPVKCSCGSDITLGDFWGVQAAHPEVDYEGGVSAVLCNTAKGAAAIEALKSRVQWGGSSLEKVLPGNPSLVRSVTPYDVFDSIRFTGLSTESLGF